MWYCFCCVKGTKFGHTRNNTVFPKMSKSIVKSMVKTHAFYLLYTFSGVDSIIFQIQPVTRLETSSYPHGFHVCKGRCGNPSAFSFRGYALSNYIAILLPFVAKPNIHKYLLVPRDQKHLLNLKEIVATNPLQSHWLEDQKTHHPWFGPIYHWIEIQQWHWLIMATSYEELLNGFAKQKWKWYEVLMRQLMKFWHNWSLYASCSQHPCFLMGERNGYQDVLWKKRGING